MSKISQLKQRSQDQQQLRHPQALKHKINTEPRRDLLELHPERKGEQSTNETRVTRNRLQNSSSSSKDIPQRQDSSGTDTQIWSAWSLSPRQKSFAVCSERDSPWMF